jgi:hypothetical protein
MADEPEDAEDRLREELDAWPDCADNQSISGLVDLTFGELREIARRLERLNNG